MLPLSRLKQNLRYWQTKKHARRWEAAAKLDGTAFVKICALFALQHGPISIAPLTSLIQVNAHVPAPAGWPWLSEAPLGHELPIAATQPGISAEKTSLLGDASARPRAAPMLSDSLCCLYQKPPDKLYRMSINKKARPGPSPDSWTRPRAAGDAGDVLLGMPYVRPHDARLRHQLTSLLRNKMFDHLSFTATSFSTNLSKFP